MTARASLRVRIRSLKGRTLSWSVAGVLLVGCSLQNFDYLSEGETPSAANGGSAGSSGGTKNQAGSGSGGTTAGKAGNAGNDGGNDDKGGAPGAGGEDASGGTIGQGDSGDGGTNNGGTNNGGTNNGGTNSGGNGGTNNGGTGAVGAIVNPSFETASTFGWTVVPSQALSKKYIFVQWPVGAATVPDGSYELSTWHETDAFSLEIYQTILGIEDGTYTFKGYFSRGDGFDAVELFARNCGGPDPEPVPIPLTTPSQWLAVEVKGIEVVGGSCQVGMSMQSNPGNWLNADLFTFEREVQTEE
jgi:hypothetical protein